MLANNIRELQQAFTLGAQTLFQARYDARLPLAERLATRIESETPTQNYAWLGDLPVVREFLGERVVADLRAYSYQIENRKWETTIAVDRDVFEYRQFDALRVQIEGLAEAAVRHSDELIGDLIAMGTTALGYDGAPFYSEDHPTTGVGGGGTASNLAELALTLPNLQTAMAIMQSRKTDAGRPLAVTPTHLLVSPSLRFTARDVLASAYFPGGGGGGGSALGNPDESPDDAPLRLLVSPYLSSPTEWHLFDLSRSVRPFVWQQRGRPQILALDTRDGETTESFLRDRLLYGLRIVDNAGYGLWQYAFRGNE